MLTTALIEQILTQLPHLRIGVLGDLFLDRYLDIDAALTEPSIETGLDAYQVVRVRSYPGAAGTVINNLAALGVGRIMAVAVVGDDGEGHELRQALARLPAVDTAGVASWPGLRTPTYTKPMFCEPGKPPRELNRLDIKNRTPLSPEAEERVLAVLAEEWPRLDALIVLDQVSEANCGIITDRVRERLAELGEAEPGKLILADSRERIGLFRSVVVKVNRTECAKAVNQADAGDWQLGAGRLATRSGRPVFCTAGEEGIFLYQVSEVSSRLTRIRAYPVSGPFDPVGAGDSTSAGIACAVAAGATLEQAAAFGNLVASITIQQIGTTGTATPEQVRARWREVHS
jgi:bifunctional ADP-heptose synthase (sugar kinase/adenylyltransferase)